MIRFRSQRSGIFEANLDRYQAYGGVDSFRLKSGAQGSISTGDNITMQTGGGNVVRTEEGTSAPVDSAVTIHIDSKRNVYSVSFDIKGKTKYTLTGPGSPPQTNDNKAGLHYSSGNLPLPKESNVIRGQAVFVCEPGSGQLGTNLVEEGAMMKTMGGETQNPVHVHWQFGRPGPKPPLILELSIKDYATWLPEGPMPGAPGSAPGNTAMVVATLKRKDGQPVDRGAMTIQFALTQSSTEPGVCLNYPLEAKADKTDFDLRYLDGADAKPIGRGAQKAETPIGDWRKASAMIGAFDWGAYGTFTVVAYVPDYGYVAGKLEGTEEQTVRLPKRSADSFIGDAWKKAHGVTDLPDTDDSEKSDGNTNNGDGYTLYEEYRGAFARGKHSRHDEDAQFDPKRKDLVVLIAQKERTVTYEIDKKKYTIQLRPVGESHLAETRSGTRLLESAMLKSHVVLMQQDESPETHQINANSGYTLSGAQHGVLLYDLAPDLSAEGSSDLGLTFPLQKHDKTPGKTEFVAIDFTSAATVYVEQAKRNAHAGIKQPFTLLESIANTVAHELSHACGASHHGDNQLPDPLRDFGADNVPPKHTILGVDGSEVTDRPFHLAGSVALEESCSSGDLTCIMCYPNAYSWRRKTLPGHNYVWQALLPLPMGTTLCTSRDGTPANTLYGPASDGNGNCRAKIRLRDY
jgi:hypothetical protein